MVQIRTRVARASVARTSRINRRRIVFVARVFDIKLAKVCKKRAISRISTRHHAVKHIHSAMDCLDQILRRAHAHKIARLRFWEQGRGVGDCGIHLVCALAHSKSAKRVAIKV